MQPFWDNTYTILQLSIAVPKGFFIYGFELAVFKPMGKMTFWSPDWQYGYACIHQFELHELRN